jgi:hypothetical protein
MNPLLLLVQPQHHQMEQYHNNQLVVVVNHPPYQCEIHHDTMMLHSQLDVGKLYERKFMCESGSSRWLVGCITAYDPVTDKHTTMFQDGAIKTTKLTLSDFIPKADVGNAPR